MVRGLLGAERCLDTVAANLRQLQVDGWPLVETTQDLVHQRFLDYSCLYWWESPAVAFERRRGYCIQYNTALYEVLCRLGIDCMLVYAARVRLANDPIWRMGHVWVQVAIDGEVRDVCAGSSSLDANSPRFEPLTPVRRLGAGLKSLTVVGTAMAVVAASLSAGITHSARPRWLHHPFGT